MVYVELSNIIIIRAISLLSGLADSEADLRMYDWIKMKRQKQN